MKLNELTQNVVDKSEYFVICESYEGIYYDGRKFNTLSPETEVYSDGTFPDEVVTNGGYTCKFDGGCSGMYSPEIEFDDKLWDDGDLDVYDGYQDCTIQARKIVIVEVDNMSVSVEMEYKGGGTVLEHFEKTLSSR